VMPGDTCHSYLLDKDAIVLKGMGKKTSPSEVCDVTVAAANNARWMFHIQTAVIMDCRVKILVYDKRIVVSAIPTPPVLVVGCASRDPGVIRFNSSVVTVRLYHKNESDYSFNLLITARDISPRCQGFKCSSGDCIPKSLMCDGVDNCFDFSDEAKNGTAYCDYNWPFQGENWGVLVSVLGVGLVLGVTAACCRQLRKRRDSFDELYDMNEGPYVHKYVTNPLGMKVTETGARSDSQYCASSLLPRNMTSRPYAAFDGIDLGIECSDGTSVLKKRVGGEAAAMAPGLNSSRLRLRQGCGLRDATSTPKYPIVAFNHLMYRAGQTVHKMQLLFCKCRG
ncbi:hypothetical protein BaRGS_00002968, partial [Batillaria attramentaria]